MFKKSYKTRVFKINLYVENFCGYVENQLNQFICEKYV